MAYIHFFLGKSGNWKGNDNALRRVMKMYAEIYNKGSHHNDRGHGDWGDTRGSPIGLNLGLNGKNG